jgi:hypothetical protein
MNQIKGLHDALVIKAETWLRSIGCGIVFTELVVSTSTGEVPDAIGWKSGGRLSFLVECKTSRNDFLAERRKSFRRDPTRGMGDWRFYLTLAGVIRPDEVPAGWGLLYFTDGRVRAIKGKPSGNVWGPSPFAGCKRAEMAMMASALRRLHLRGVLPMIYDPLDKATLTRPPAGA